LDLERCWGWTAAVERTVCKGLLPRWGSRMPNFDWKTERFEQLGDSPDGTQVFLSRRENRLLKAKCYKNVYFTDEIRVQWQNFAQQKFEKNIYVRWAA
jgi:hypothetical protein